MPTVVSGLAANARPPRLPGRNPEAPVAGPTKRQEILRRGPWSDYANDCDTSSVSPVTDRESADARRHRPAEPTVARSSSVLLLRPPPCSTSLTQWGTWNQSPLLYQSNGLTSNPLAAYHGSSSLSSAGSRQPAVPLPGIGCLGAVRDGASPVRPRRCRTSPRAVSPISFTNTFIRRGGTPGMFADRNALPRRCARPAAAVDAILAANGDAYTG